MSSLSTLASPAPPLGNSPFQGTQPRRSLRWEHAAGLGLLLLLMIWCYGTIAGKLVRDWYDIPDASHGFLIPFFIAFVLWERREALGRIPLAPSWSGIALLLAGLSLLVLGVFGADLFLSRISFVVVAAGLVWSSLGWPMLRATSFVFFLALLAIPLPALLINQITFPLQLLASQLSSSLLPLAGVPVLRNGNVIQLPSMQLEVAEACSGIRSLVSLFTVAVIFAYFFEQGTARRVLLSLSSIPIAVAANALRIFGTGLCVQYWDPDKAVGFFHEFSGWLMFLVSLACLYGVHRLMRLRIFSPRESAA